MNRFPNVYEPTAEVTDLGNGDDAHAYFALCQKLTDAQKTPPRVRPVELELEPIA